MTHDPMCDRSETDWFITGGRPICTRCTLIAKVRADTLDTASWAVQVMPPEPLPKVERGGPSQVRKNAVLELLHSLRGES